MSDNKNNDGYIDSVCNDVIYAFRRVCICKNIDGGELEDHMLDEIVRKYLSFQRLTDAIGYSYNAVSGYLGDTYDNIDWKMDRNERESTQDYIRWKYTSSIKSMLYLVFDEIGMKEKWAEIHGQSHTDEEAAEIAAGKWCEMLFNFHFQDNGDVNSQASFNMCALGTILANDAKKDITKENMDNAHNLFREYYLHYINYSRKKGCIKKDTEWIHNTFCDLGYDFNWKAYGFMMPYCDYNPNTILMGILVKSGIREDVAHSICPWKTGISIRPEDNMVMYKTYGKCEEL